MLIDTYRFGRVDVPAASICGKQVLRVTRTTVIAVGFPSQLLEEGVLLVRRSGKYAIYASIEAAIRVYNRAIRNYGTRHRGELAKLAMLSAAADEYMEAIMNDAALNREAEEATESVLAGLGAMLSGSSNRHKHAARHQLSAAAAPRDRLGRKNSGRQALLLAQARNHLSRRATEVGRIKTLIMPWLTELGGYYRERVLALREMKELLGCLSRQIWMGASRSEVLDNYRQVETYRLIDCLLARLDLFNVEPFITCRDLTISDLHQAHALLRQQRFAEARAALTRALTGVRIGLARVRLENIRVALGQAHPENRFPFLEAKAVDELVAKQKKRLREFLTNLGTLDDADLAVRNLSEVRSQVGQVIALLEERGALEQAVADLGAAVLLL